MEAELLRNMISDRDARIGRITRKTSELNDREERLRSQQIDLQLCAKRESKNQEEEKKQFIDLYLNQLKQLRDKQISFQQQAQSLHTYASSSLQAKDRAANDSTYVMRMQAQLCKAMHSMGICEHQLELLTAQNDALIKYHKELITKQREERTHIELQLMNDLMLQDNERREIEAGFKKRLDEIRKERDIIEKQLEENRDEDDEDEIDEEEEEEEDEEEKEAKEELMNLLKERNEEISRLRSESVKRQNHIKEIEDQLRELGADVTPSKQLVKTKKKKVSREIGSSDEDEDDDDDDEDDEDDDTEGDYEVEYEETEGIDDDEDLKKLISRSSIANITTSSKVTVDDDNEIDDEDEENEDEEDEEDQEDQEDEEDQNGDGGMKIKNTDRNLAVSKIDDVTDEEAEAEEKKE